jgi:D-glycero-beta-D-manno-heptose-7-phosphate kinase
MQRINRPTTLKMRIMGNKHQLLRVDEEDDSPLDESAAGAFRKHLTQMMEQERFDVVIFEDYDKGLIDPLLIETVVKLAGKKNIPVAVDPKKRNFNAYKNVTLFKPNLKEIREGLKTDVDPLSKNSIVQAERLLRDSLQHKISLITMSEHGAYAANQLESFFLPAHVRNIADVSGAGDTVISVAALCLAAGTSLSELAFLSNLAGGQVCEKPGVIPVNSSQLFEEAKRFIR